jgi:hypothetical protein
MEQMELGENKKIGVIKNDTNGGMKTGKIGDIILNSTNGGRKSGKCDIIKNVTNGARKSEKMVI